MKKFVPGLVAGTVLLALGGVACSSSDGADTSSGSTVATSSAGGSGAPADGEPIVIGLANLEGGVVSLPEFRYGAEAAAGYVNDELGGVDGRPIELFRCDVDVSPESSIDCANQFVEKGVTAVLMGVDSGIDASLPILESAGITLVAHSPFSPGAEAAPNAVFFGSSYRGRTLAQLDQVAAEGKKKVTFLLGDDPGSHDLADKKLTPHAETLGVDYKTVYFTQGSADWSVLIATAMVDDPDVIGLPASTEPDCIAFVSAAVSAGYQGQLMAGNCNLFVSTLGSEAEGVVIASDLWRIDDIEAAPPAKQDQLNTYIEVMDAAGHGDLTGGYANQTFSDVVNLAEVLRTIPGEIDNVSAGEALHATSHLDSFMGPVVTCVDGRTTCGDWVLFYVVTPEGKLEAISEDFTDISAVLDQG